MLVSPTAPNDDDANTAVDVDGLLVGYAAASGLVPLANPMEGTIGGRDANTPELVVVAA